MVWVVGIESTTFLFPKQARYRCATPSQCRVTKRAGMMLWSPFRTTSPGSCKVHEEYPYPDGWFEDKPATRAALARIVFARQPTRR